MVIALAGRRIDASDAAQARFPLANRQRVRELLRDAFITAGAHALVCSGACGSDLLALDVAAELALERRLILPFGARHFRRVSVADRPGAWGPFFDRIYRDMRAANHVETLRGHGWGHAAYEAVTLRILEVALANAGAQASEPLVTAVVVWDMASRGPDDLTERFLLEAKARGLPVVEVSTL